MALKKMLGINKPKQISADHFIAFKLYDASVYVFTGTGFVSHLVEPAKAMLRTDLEEALPKPIPKDIILVRVAR